MFDGYSAANAARPVWRHPFLLFLVALAAIIGVVWGVSKFNRYRERQRAADIMASLAPDRAHQARARAQALERLRLLQGRLDRLGPSTTDDKPCTDPRLTSSGYILEVVEPARLRWHLAGGYRPSNPEPEAPDWLSTFGIRLALAPPGDRNDRSRIEAWTLQLERLAAAPVIALLEAPSTTEVRIGSERDFSGGTVQAVVSLRDVETGSELCRTHVASVPLFAISAKQREGDSDVQTAMDRHAIGDASASAYHSELKKALQRVASGVTLADAW
ncbi:MAG: hypothetical protein SFX73_04295 [Kofleriaceae bacterium]|nr:hypothetical protein [Kofleriaceae bacterium]